MLPRMARARRFVLRNDVEILAAVLFWAFNMTVVKLALRTIDPLAFNLIRFLCASGLLLLVARLREGSLRIEPRDRGRLILAGLVGHAIYQICFIEGVSRTTASSASLLFGASPVVIAVVSRLAGHERIHLAGAAGALLGFYGVFLIVGGAGVAGAGSPIPSTQIAGDLLIVAGVICWAIYTVVSRSLLRAYSPLRLTALSMSIGTLILIPLSLPAAMRQDWAAVSPQSWAGLCYSFLFALVISYVVWYRSVKAVGAVRTAIYSNLVPVFGTIFGVWLLGERLTAGLGFGAACIMGGIALTRLQGRRDRGNEA